MLLSFSPLDNEEDLSVQSMFDFVADTLSRYDQPWSSVKFMVADNCAVNQYIDSRVGAVPPIGCASHRYNLAVSAYLAQHERLLAKVHKLMSKLRSLKCRALLRTMSPLAPILRNETRWSSAHAMVQRYFELKTCIDSLPHSQLSSSGLASLLLTASERVETAALFTAMRDFQAVTLALQKSTITLSAARRLFDHAIKTYPATRSRLAPAAPIVNFPSLESGLVKLQQGERLCSAELPAVAPFEIDTRDAGVSALQSRPLGRTHCRLCSTWY